MEYIGHETDTIYGSLHGPGYSGINNLGEPKNLLENDFTDDFHVFSIEWTAEEITWLLDGEVYHSVSPADLPEDREWVYDQPFFILLNFAVGGYWPGNPDSSTEFPAEVVVDYVRVYQASANYETNSYTVSDDFEGWQLIEIPFEDMSSTASNFNSSDVWGYQFELGVSEVVIDNFGFVE
ncbi:MAG: glycoside hydrolase family 16 protein, partial [Chloroflexi bacterium]|nr:glycoside hydrolase family 16 protein [Chloroflexota bacterium]